MMRIATGRGAKRSSPALHRAAHRVGVNCSLPSGGRVVVIPRRVVPRSITAATGLVPLGECVVGLVPAPVRSRPAALRRTVRVCRSAGALATSSQSSPTTCSPGPSGTPARSWPASPGARTAAAVTAPLRGPGRLSKVVRGRGHGSCPLRPRQHGALLPARGIHPRDGPGWQTPDAPGLVSLPVGVADDAGSPAGAVGDPDHFGIPWC